MKTNAPMHRFWYKVFRNSESGIPGTKFLGIEKAEFRKKYSACLNKQNLKKGWGNCYK
jgi:hypothetical protein